MDILARQAPRYAVYNLAIITLVRLGLKGNSYPIADAPSVPGGKPTYPSG
jgi:hypothetical protein